MHLKPSLKTTWYEKAAWAICPPLARKIRQIREDRAERARWKQFDKLLFARKDFYAKLTPAEFVEEATKLFAELGKGS